MFYYFTVIFPERQNFIQITLNEAIIAKPN